jgi:hypothetical protein
MNAFSGSDENLHVIPAIGEPEAQPPAGFRNRNTPTRRRTRRWRSPGSSHRLTLEDTHPASTDRCRSLNRPESPRSVIPPDSPLRHGSFGPSRAIRRVQRGGPFPL